jgi:hypothetical protein
LERLSEEDEDKAMLAYLEEWMQSHIVDGADFDLKVGTNLDTLAGDEHTLALEDRTDAGQEDWEKVIIQPGGAVILEVKEVSTAYSGDILLLSDLPCCITRRETAESMSSTESSSSFHSYVEYVAL